MTEIEAIEMLSVRKFTTVLWLTKIESTKENKAIDMAIEALKKQAERKRECELCKKVGEGVCMNKRVNYVCPNFCRKSE